MKHAASFICLILLLAGAAHGRGRDTFEVHFAKNEVMPGKSACDYMDKLIFQDMLIPGQKLMVLGYADYVGDTQHNNLLSASRANNVKDYLVKMGLNETDIKLCMGKGEIERTATLQKDGFARDRKVQIIIDKPPVAVKPVVAKPAPLKEMTQLKVNETVALNNLFFQPGAADMLPTSYPELEKLYKFLEQNKTVTIRIEGHVCCLGPIEGRDMDNLSEYRAAAVFDYLVEKGINSRRMRYVGLGNSNPVVKEEVTEDDRKKNRRVEIRIMGK
jgi:outer membrane protein OmpA-like peptidoglycan-associated protein